MNITPEQFLNMAFSRTTLKSLIKNHHNQIYDQAVNQWLTAFGNKTHREIISDLYAIIKTAYRNEYFFKNSFFNSYVFNQLDFNHTTVLSEIPVARSIADLILVNDQATVIEIKSDLDNFNRLKSQLDNYYQAFGQVCLFISREKLNSLLQHLDNEYPGIYCLTKEGEIKIYRSPLPCLTKLNQRTIFKILRKAEYEKIISHHYPLPQTTQFKYYPACRELFLKLPLMQVHQEFKEQLRAGVKVNIKLFKKVPSELKGLVYFSKFRDKDYEALNKFLAEKFTPEPRLM